jgi:hypothetical protein
MSLQKEAWRDQPLLCDVCGRALLVGERSVIVSRGDEMRVCCPLCRERALAEGYETVGLGPSVAAETALSHVNVQQRLAV